MAFSPFTDASNINILNPWLPIVTRSKSLMKIFELCKKDGITVIRCPGFNVKFRVVNECSFSPCFSYPFRSGIYNFCFLTGDAKRNGMSPGGPPFYYRVDEHPVINTFLWLKITPGKP